MPGWNFLGAEGGDGCQSWGGGDKALRGTHEVTRDDKDLRGMTKLRGDKLGIGGSERGHKVIRLREG